MTTSLTKLISLRHIVACLALVTLLTASAQAGRSVAILVGVTNYEKANAGGLDNLEFCENDVEALANLLTDSQGHYRFEEENVHVLTQQRAAKVDAQGNVSIDTDLLPTKTRIESLLIDVLPTLNSSDRIFIAFSGHGLRLKGKSYFCPQDTDLTDANPTGSMISLDDLYVDLKKSRAGLKVIFCDACRNDAEIVRQKSKGLKAKALLGQADGFDADLGVPENSDIALFQSCAGGETSQELKELQHGIFFHHLLKALEGDVEAKYLKDGKLELAGLGDFLSSSVRAVRPDQNPTYRIEVLDKERSVLLEFPWLPEGFEPAFGRFKTKTTIYHNTLLYKAIKTTRGGEEIRFRLVEYKRNGVEKRPFYVMETKVWNGLFQVFAKAHPERLDERTRWGTHPVDSSKKILAGDAVRSELKSLPAVYISPKEAMLFADWLGVRMPTRSEWEAAAGRYHDRAGLVGPFKAPVGGGTPNVAVGRVGLGPVSVHEHGDDVCTATGVCCLAGNGYEFTATPYLGIATDDETMYTAETAADFDPVALWLCGCSWMKSKPLSYRDIQRRRPNVQEVGSNDISFRVVLTLPTEE